MFVWSRVGVVNAMVGVEQIRLVRQCAHGMKRSQDRLVRFRVRTTPQTEVILIGAVQKKLKKSWICDGWKHQGLR